MAVTGEVIGAGIDVLGSAISGGVDKYQVTKSAQAIAGGQREAARILAEKQAEADEIKKKAATNLLIARQKAQKVMVYSLLGMASVVAVFYAYKKLN